MQAPTTAVHPRPQRPCAGRPRSDLKAAARRPGLAGLTAGGRSSPLARYAYQLTLDWTESVCSGAAAAGSRRAATSSIRRSATCESPRWKAYPTR